MRLESFLITSCSQKMHVSLFQKPIFLNLLYQLQAQEKGSSMTTKDVSRLISILHILSSPACFKNLKLQAKLLTIIALL